MKSGIYKILNRITGKFYIGSALNFKKRWYVHLCRLRQNGHDNAHLQSAYNKHGEDAFDFLVLEVCTKDELLSYEQKWIDNTKCYNREIGYNACPTAGNSIGYKHTPEAKAKMIAQRTGRKLSEETKRKMSEASKGKAKSKEHAANIAKGKILKLNMGIVPLIRKDDGSWL